MVLLRRREPDRGQAVPLDRLGELVQCGNPLIAELQPHHALCALDAIQLGAAVVEIGDDPAQGRYLASLINIATA